MKLLVVDTETTGLSPRFNRVLTIGLLPIEVDKERLEILNSEHIFVKHERYNADPKALAVNKIDLQEHTKRAVIPKQACKQINLFIEKNELLQTPVLGHNVGFDRGFLTTLFEKEKHTPKLHHESVDTMYMWRWLKGQGKVPYDVRANLGALAKFFEVDYTKAHDAIADCHITAKVYQKMLGIM